MSSTWLKMTLFGEVQSVNDQRSEAFGFMGIETVADRKDTIPASLPKVAILLATHNGANWLDLQLRSILQQTHANWILFSQDDASSDTTGELLLHHASQDARIQAPRLLQTRLGSATANFFALLQACDWAGCDYVALCDQDDVWAPDKLARGIHCLQREGSQAYSCDLVAFDNDRHTARYLAKGGRYVQGDHLFQGASAGCTYLLTRAAATLVRERVAERRSAALGSLSHDWLIYAICRGAGLRWTHDRTALVFYRQHGRNAYGAGSRWHELNRKLQLIRSGWYRRMILENGRYIDTDAWSREVLNRIEHLTVSDCLWLARRAHHFRRRPVEIWWLRLMLLIGFL